MKIQSIKTKADYQAALARINQLWDEKPNTLEGLELEAMVTQVEAFESEHCHIETPDPAEASKFRKEQESIALTQLIKVSERSGEMPFDSAFGDGND